MSLVNSNYEHKLAYVYHQIDNRGLHVDTAQLDNVRVQCQQELNKLCNDLSKLWGFDVYVGRENNTKQEKALNINTPAKVLDRLKELGYKVPKIRKKDQETHEYEFVESVNDIALQKLYADSALWPDLLAGNGIKWLLDARELITFRNRYINARLHRGKYYCNYNVASTVTGRRGSKKSLFGFGGNAQNFPARGRLADLWKKCIVAGKGRIFLFVDQRSAEDWPVQALAENYVALEEMRSGVNRHYKFASGIFGRPIQDLKNARKDKSHPLHEQCEMEYYFGKKGRHANNYGMQPTRLSEQLAAEGFSYSSDACKHILLKVDEIDPNVKRIFHKYIQNCAYNDKLLRTPFGRERQVFGLRNGERNYIILNELYAYIPQSLVGDNTGLAVVSIFDAYDGRDNIVQESHDSLCQELQDTENSIIKGATATIEGFHRTINFHNGISIEIPIETKLGYDWYNTIDIVNDKGEPSMEIDDILKTYRKLKETRGEGSATTVEEVMA